MKSVRIGIATAAAGFATAALMVAGAGSAAAASGLAYCYKNVTNDNGTRVIVSYSTSPNAGAWRLDLSWNYQQWTGSYYENSSGPSSRTLQIGTQFPSAGNLCAAADASYGVGTF